MTAPITRPHTAHHPPEPAYAIRTRGLAKSYPGPHGTITHAVRDLDLDVPQGETFAFLGPNGAGKSTTIALLCTLARPTAGHATVAGVDVLTHPRQVRRQIGMLFQHSALDPDLTADQNLHIHARLYGLRRRYARRRATEVLEMVGLTDRRHCPVRTLSGGMRRRLEIARGLLHAPRVLFLDEPTTGLDPHARAEVWQHLRALRDQHGSTLFVTTHYLDEAENCDRIAIIDRGRLVAQGAPFALKTAIGDDQVMVRTSDDRTAQQVVRQMAPSDRVITVDANGICLRAPDGSAFIPRLESGKIPEWTRKATGTDAAALEQWLARHGWEVDPTVYGRRRGSGRPGAVDRGGPAGRRAQVADLAQCKRLRQSCSRRRA